MSDAGGVRDPRARRRPLLRLREGRSARLVEARGPFVFTEEENPADEITVTYVATDPQVAILERGDQTVVAYQAVSASGARYEGRNVTFRTEGDEALVTWGYGEQPRTYRLR